MTTTHTRMRGALAGIAALTGLAGLVGLIGLVGLAVRRRADRKRHGVHGPASPAAATGRAGMSRKDAQAFAQGALLYPVGATGRPADAARRCDIAGCERPCVDLIAEPNGSLLLACAECSRALAGGPRR